MRNSLFVFFLVLSINPVWAQKINVDSLTRVALSRAGSVRSSGTINRDSLFKLLPSTKSPAGRIKIIYDILYNYGSLNPDQSLIYHKKILSFAQNNHDRVCEAVITAELGFLIVQGGDYVEGNKTIFKALKMAEETGNSEAIGIVYNNLGVCGTNISLKKIYFQKALRFSEAGQDYVFACYDLGGLSFTYSSLHQPDSAEYFILKAYDLAVRKKIDQSIPGLLAAIADLEKNKGRQLQIYQQVLNMPATRDNAETMGGALYYLSSFYLKEGKRDSALYYAKRAYENSRNQYYISRINAVDLLSKIYRKLNSDSALKYTLQYNVIKDSTLNLKKIEQSQSLALANQQRQQALEQEKAAYKNNLRFYMLVCVIIFLFVIAFIFWRNNKQNRRAKAQIQHTLDELKLTQQQLIQSEKMASLGELTAGIAHEIQNPLNFVNNFAEVNIELLDEMETELKSGDREEALSIASDVKQNLEKIRHHGQRADGIVKGMLQHSRAGSNTKEPTDINKLADEYLRLAYHGLRAKDKNFNAELETNFDPKLPLVNLVPQDIGRVLLNLFTNAFYATEQRRKLAANNYSPVVKVGTAKIGDNLEIRVRDNGNGIPDNIRDKVMQPFFTTKPTGEGTGLGLSMSYDIVVKGHGGSIQVESKEGEFTEFIIQIPA
jgi:two-component system NtrC family sensor kinase